MNNKIGIFFDDLVFYHFQFKKRYAPSEMKTFFNHIWFILNNYKSYGLVYCLDFFEKSVENFRDSVQITRLYQDFLYNVNDEYNIPLPSHIEEVYICYVTEYGRITDKLSFDAMDEEELKEYLQEFDIVYSDPMG